MYNLACLYSSIHIAGMPNHIAIGVVYEDKFIISALYPLNQLIRNEICAHLRFFVISRHFFGRWDKHPFFYIEWLFYTDIKEKCYVRVFFCLCNPQLLYFVFAQDLAEDILQALRRKYNRKIECGIIFCKAHIAG